MSTPDQLTCAVTTVELTANATNVSYSWSNGLGTESTAVASAVGVYSVTVTDLTNGCTAVSTVEVETDSDLPSVGIQGNETLDCTTTAIVLTVTSDKTVTYKWSDNSTASTISVTNAVADNTEYAVTVTAGNGCSANTKVSVTVNTTAPTVSIADVDAITCAVTQVQLTANASGVTYAWSNGLGSASTANVTAAGTYSVTERKSAE